MPGYPLDLIVSNNSGRFSSSEIFDRRIDKTLQVATWTGNLAIALLSQALELDGKISFAIAQLLSDG